MSVTNYQDVGAVNKYPDNINILKDTKFKFVVRKIPNTVYFCTVAEVPEISSPTPIRPTPFADIPLPGTGLNYADLEIQFLVDENLQNYYEIVKWMSGLGFVKDFDAYASLKNERVDVNATHGGIWSDATLHILNNEGNPNVNVIYRNAFPFSLSELRFDSRKPKAEPQIATALFKYAYYDFEFPKV